jgi:hypothetical protein
MARWTPRRVHPVRSGAEVSGYLVGSAAFKAVGLSEPQAAGSIPVHFREIEPWSHAFVGRPRCGQGFEPIGTDAVEAVGIREA